MSEAQSSSSDTECAVSVDASEFPRRRASWQFVLAGMGYDSEALTLDAIRQLRRSQTTSEGCGVRGPSAISDRPEGHVGSADGTRVS